MVVGILLSGCGGVSQKEYDALKKENEQIPVLKSEILELKQVKKENEQLTKELEELKNSPDRLLAATKLDLEKDDFESAKSHLTHVIENNPETYYAKEAKKLLENVNAKISKQEAQAAKAEQDKIDDEKKRRAKIINKLRSNTDYMTGITKYHDPSTPRNETHNTFHIYIIKEKSIPTLRCKIITESNSSLQIKSYDVITDKGSYSLVPKAGEIKSSQAKKDHIDIYDTAIDGTLYSILKEIIDSKSVKIRCNGKENSEERELTKNEREGVLNVLNGYEALGGNMSF